MKRQTAEASTSYVTLICLVAALGGVLFGYDTAVISGAIGFLQEYFTLSPAATGWAASSALVGCILGVAGAGVLSDGIGRKKTLILSAVLFLISAVGTALPEVLATFVFFRMVGGVGVGIASMVVPMYIAEVSPARIRGRMVSVYQLAITSGMLAVYFVNYFIAGQGTAAWNVAIGWRWMFASEALPAFLFLCALYVVPETPRWLAKQGRTEAARRVLTRLLGPVRAEGQLREIEAALAREEGSLRQLFRPGWRVLLVTGVTLAVLQQATGINVFLYYAPEIFQKLGAGADTALFQTVLVGGVNLGFTVVAIWTVDRLGRKPLLIVGAAGMGLSLAALGLAAFFQQIEGWALIFVLGYIACFAVSLGPVVWVVLSEIFPNRIRGRAMAVATVCLWATNFVVSQTFPMMAENAWLNAAFHGAFPFWVYAFLCGVTVLFVWRVVPETKEKSLEEIEAMWGIDVRDAVEANART